MLQKNILHLYAFENSIKSINNLSQFENLVVVDLHRNQIGCVTGAFANMRGLKKLRLDNNNLKSVLLEDMQGCSSLVYLNIGSNKLENINFLQSLPNLEFLDASNNELWDVSGLQFCKALNRLYVSKNKIENIKDPLSKLIHLTAIDFSNNRICSFVGLEAFGHLKHVDFAGNDLDSFAAVALVFPNSEYLNFGENRIKDPDEILRHLYSEEFPCMPKKVLRPDAADAGWFISDYLPVLKPSPTCLNVEIMEDIETQLLSFEELGDLFTGRIIKGFARFQEALAALPSESFWSDPCNENPSSVTSDKRSLSARSQLQDALNFARTTGSINTIEEGSRDDEG